jgi:hypothetical protein
MNKLFRKTSWEHLRTREDHTSQNNTTNTFLRLPENESPARIMNLSKHAELHPHPILSIYLFFICVKFVSN